eukprot:Em0015g185a
MYLSLLIGGCTLLVYFAKIAGGQYTCDSPARVYRQPIGRTIYLVCGCPLGTSVVAWYKNGTETPLLQETVPDIYTVHVRSAEDGGAYGCVCDLSVTACFVLKVDNEITQCEIVPTYVPVGGVMTVYCGAVGFPPPAKCDVSGPIPNMVSVALNGSLGQLLVSNVTLSNSGMYSCIVYDGVTVDEKKTYVTVYEQPEIIEFDYSIEKCSAVLLCRVSNHSLHIRLHSFKVAVLINTSLQTSKYNVQILEQTNTSANYVLTIADFSQDDTGVYTCQVGSPYRTVEQQQVLNITRFPSILAIVVSPTSNTTASSPGNGSVLYIVIPVVVVAIVLIVAVVVVVLVLCALKSRERHRMTGSSNKLPPTSGDIEMAHRNPTSTPTTTRSDPVPLSSTNEHTPSPMATSDPTPPPPTDEHKLSQTTTNDSKPTLSTNDGWNPQSSANDSTAPPTLSTPQTSPLPLPPAPSAPPVLPTTLPPSRAQSG